MSTNGSGAFSSHDADAQFENEKIQTAIKLAEQSDSELVTLLVEIVKEQDEELHQEREARKELETTVEELQEERTEEIATDGGPQTIVPEIRSDDPDNYEMADIWLGEIPLGNILDANLSRSKKNRKEVEETKDNTESHQKAITYLNSVVEAGSSDAEGRVQTEQTAPQIRETPLERVLIDPNSSGVRITESVTRALSLAAHFDKWSKSVKAGLVITEDIKKMVNTALDENLDWKQTHRACHKLEDLSNGKIEFKSHDKHGRILVMEDKSWLSSLKRDVSETHGG